MKRNGTYCQVGNPDDGAYSVHPGVIIAKKIKFTGSSIGSPDDIREMFRFAVEKNTKVWVEQRPMADANQAILDMEAGKARYRYVLTN